MTPVRPLDRRNDVVHRLAPLTGVLFAALTLGGDFVIGPFPEGSTPADQLPAYYAVHAGQVALGGYLAAAGSLFFALFGVVVWCRLRDRGAPPIVLGTVLVGVAVETVVALDNAANCILLAELGVQPNVSPAALQAWQIGASQFGPTGGIGLLLLGVAAAGIVFRLLPRWLAWGSLLLGIAQVTSVGFLASLVFTAAAAVAGIVLTVRPVAVPGREQVPVSSVS